MTDTTPITKQTLTYNSKVDPSNADQRLLVSPSKNVIINDAEKVGSRMGYTLQSGVGISGNDVKGSDEWNTSSGDTFPLKADGTILEVFIDDNWETLMDSLTSVNLIFALYWDNTEKIDRLVWCDGSPDIKDWSGATATLSSITAATVTLEGTDTFGKHRFLTTGTRSIRIKDDNGTWHSTTYSGGESTITLTGLGTDLTAFPFTGGNLIVQEVITRANLISSTFNIDSVRVVDSQLGVLSRTSNLIYFSKNTDITSFTFSTPRAVGEGLQFTLDGPGRAIATLRGDIILFAGKGFVYKSVFNQITVGSSLAETVKVELLKTTSLQGALHQNLVANIGNGLAWIGHDNVLYELNDAGLSYNPDLIPLSDPLKPDFDATDFTGGHMKLHKTRLYISAPLSGVNFIYEYRLVEDGSKRWFWQPPQTFPVNRWAVIDDAIHGHSSDSNETYKLFDGLRDNNAAIHSIARRARWNGGVRNELKNADEMFNEGTISANTVIDVLYDFDLDGGDNNPVDKTIKGSDENIVYQRVQDPSLGNDPLGDDSLSGDVVDTNLLPKFRSIHEINTEEFFDYGVQFETNDLDYQWEWMCHGSNATLSTGKPTAIKS